MRARHCSFLRLAALTVITLLALPTQAAEKFITLASTTSNPSPSRSVCTIVEMIENTPTRLATKFGVSLARTTPLPSVVTRNVSSWSRSSACVSRCAISSTRCM